MSLPDKIWEFDEIIANLIIKGTLRRDLYRGYRKFVERELLKNGEVAVRGAWCANISHWCIPYPGIYIPETGQVW